MTTSTTTVMVNHLTATNGSNIVRIDSEGNIIEVYGKNFDTAESIENFSEATQEECDAWIEKQIPAS